MSDSERDVIEEFLDAGEAVQDYWELHPDDRVEEELAAHYERLAEMAMEVLRICVNQGEQPPILAFRDAIRTQSNRAVSELWHEIKETLHRVLTRMHETVVDRIERPANADQRPSQ